MAISSLQLSSNDIQANYELENDYPEFFEKCNYVTSDNQLLLTKKDKMIYFWCTSIIEAFKNILTNFTI